MSDDPKPSADAGTQGPNCCITAAATFGVMALAAMVAAGALARAVSART